MNIRLRRSLLAVTAKLLTSVAIVLGVWTTASAGLIFAAPPRETAQAGQKIYGPIAAYLTKLLGEKVTYVHPDDWLAYQRDMRADKYDFIFDAAHFVSWRSAHLGAVPLVRLPGTSYFVIVVDAGNKKINKVGDLAGKEVCGIGPPNLGTLTVYAQFHDPARQPIIHLIRGGFMKSFKTFKAGKCVAVVLRSNVYKYKLTDADRKSVKVVFKGELLPNQGITASKRVTPAQQKKIVEALTKGSEGIKATRPLLNRFAQNAQALIPATKAEYADAKKYLEGVIFGW